MFRRDHVASRRRFEKAEHADELSGTRGQPANAIAVTIQPDQVEEREQEDDDKASEGPARSRRFIAFW